MSNDITQNSSPGALIIGRWPEGAIVYQVYPRSLQDSDGDGIGDLPGVTKRLDYLQELGVNAIWLSPFYPSPMADFGYDIADYCDVNPMFGTLDDFRALQAGCQQRGIKVMVDLVPNHSSDDHEWFQASRRSRTNRYANWYIWRDAKGFREDGTPIPPNNWKDALTGGPAWEWVEAREQFYLHGFDVRQPDLNWSNAQVREAIKEAMRFWLRLGVDGFRVDAVYWMAKDPLFRDDSPNKEYVEGTDPPYESLMHDNSRGWPAVYFYLAEMDGVLKEKEFQDKPRFMVTEAYPEGHNPVDSYLEFYAGVDPLVAAPFNFEGIMLGWEAGPWHRFLRSFHEALLQQSPLCVPSYAFGNHDQPRLASRIGEPQSRAAAVMEYSLPGMIFVYNGEEIGMVNVDIPKDKVQDPAALNDPAKGMGRDPSRTPMQWTSGPMAGFTDGDDTWLPLAPDYTERNVEMQSKDPDSHLSLYRRLGELRNSSDALRHGDIRVLELDAPHVLGFVRTYNHERLLTMVNFGAQDISVNVPLQVQEAVVSSISSDIPAIDDDERDLIRLRPHEAVIYRL
jgi:alpha-glucosidase